MGKIKSKKIIIGLITILILVITVIFAAIFMMKKDTMLLAKKTTVKHDVVNSLYENIKADECTTLGNVANNQDAIIYTAFSKMKNDKTLKDYISIDTYNNAIKSVSGNETITFSEFTYGGYKYIFKEDEIVREKTSNCDVKYVSKLFGYTYSDDKLLVDIKFGFIKDNKVYNLNSEEIGEYDEKTLNDILDKGTTKSFMYDKESNNYYINGVK